jgi:hypothetical protein
MKSKIQWFQANAVQVTRREQYAGRVVNKQIVYINISSGYFWLDYFCRNLDSRRLTFNGLQEDISQQLIL